MTFEERMDRLVERHEALAQTVELMAIENRALEERLRSVTTAIEIDAENIRALARIAESHERRLTRLEGDEENGNAL